MSLDPPQHSAESDPHPGNSSMDAALRQNLGRVMARIESASAAADRPAPTLVAVTKTVSPAVAAALARILPPPAQLGENRADVLAAKVDDFEPRAESARWHFIGSIQRNKARRIIERADVLHSIDSTRLANAVVRIADELERPIGVFVEVNLTDEDEKHGLRPADVDDVLDALGASRNVKVHGLMAMGPARGIRTTDEVFRDVAQLAADLTAKRPDDFDQGRCQLSMGMSGDLETAIQYGSNFVRVGSALFEGLQGPTADSIADSTAGPSASPTADTPSR